jgi:RNA polymerase sigma-70 factor (ECF subfamily)
MSDESQREKAVRQAAAQAERPPGPVADLATVYREHHTRVLRAAHRITGNAQDAEDVLQTVFLRLARREGGSPLSDSPGSYLHRAAVNAALDVVRSRRARRSTSLEEVEPFLPDEGGGAPDEAHGVAEVKARIRQALTKMSPKSAEIFVLRYFEGFGNNEIARMLGTSRSTVNVILHRTRNRLKEDMSEYLGEGQ